MAEVFAPYYHKFKCTADRCRHNCCIGWEIDIDPDTMRLYDSLEGELGEKIRGNIEGDIPHFILSDGDRCPFLNERGLCDIILSLGEDAICDICTLHPRFKNFYTFFTEVGLGLCCEEVGRVILGEKDKFYIELPTDVQITDEEREFFKIRSEIFDVLQKREITVLERFQALAEKYSFELSFSLSELLKRYLALDRLDGEWEDMLMMLSDFSFDGEIFRDAKLAVFFEQLAVYFVFRHLTPENANYKMAVIFSVMSTYIIGAICDKMRKDGKEPALDDIAEVARMYSSEIEYSEDNLDELNNYIEVVL